MRYLWIPALAVAGLLSGCGGGGVDTGRRPGTSTGGGVISGAVVEIDDSTERLDGVQLRMAPTGETVTSAVDGTFAFARPAPQSFSISLLRTPGQARRGRSNSGPGGGSDTDDAHDAHDARDVDADDGDESSETGVEVHRVGDGERVHIRLRIRDGRIERVEVSRSDHGEREVEVFMDRAATSDDPDIKGKLELEIRDDRNRFEVEAEQVAPGRDLESFVIDAAGSEASLGVETVNGFGEAEWEINTGDGGTLPFGAGSVLDLEGHTVEVRDAASGTVLLAVAVPEVPAGLPPGGGGDDDDDNNDGVRRRGKQRLMAQVTGLEGYVEVRSRPEDARERFKMEGEHLFGFPAAEFFVEDAPGSGSFVSVGTRPVDLEGEAELELDTGEGESLPNGAAEADQLVGLVVQIRDAVTGDVLLSGTVPALTAED